MNAPRPALAIALLAIVPVLSSLAACRREPGGDAAPGRAAQGPRRATFQREILLTGELEAVRSISIKSPQTALFQLRIQHMAEEGEPVKAGDVILSFDSASLVSRQDELKTQILDAETQIVAKMAETASALKDLEIELSEKEHAGQDARLQASVDADVLARKLWGERQLAAAKAEEELAETRKRSLLTADRGRAELDVLVIARDKLVQDLAIATQGLDLLTIRAPTDGVVVHERKMENQARYQEGDSCWPGQGILQLPDISEMRVTFAVHEVDAPALSVGMPVTVVLDAFPDREIAGVIDHVPSMAVRKADDSRISVFRMRAALSESWEGMKPGMSVRGRAVIESIPDAPVISRDEIRFDGERWWWEPGGAEPVELHPAGRSAREYLLTEDDFARLQGRKGGSA